jgi:hypothetical protein
MTIINRFESKDEFLKFRDHVAKVLAAKSVIFKPRKLDELVAQIAGASDFNTALAMCATPPGRVVVEADPDAKGALTHGLGYAVPASLTTSVGGFATQFDAAAFFENCLKHHSLFQMLAMLDRKGNPVGIAAATFMAKSNPAVECILEECADKGFKVTVTFDLTSIRDWITSSHQWIIASWFTSRITQETLEPVNFYELNRQYPDLCYHTDGEPDTQVFLSAMGRDFKLKPSRSMKSSSGHFFKWSYQGREHPVRFETKIDAIINFMDHMALVLVAEGQIDTPINPLLTHYMVVDAGVWGSGATLEEARSNKPYYQSAPLTASTQVYRCTPGTYINDDGGISRPRNDPAPVRVDHKTGLPR